MSDHDRADAIEHRNVAEQTRADRRVGAHLDPLIFGELGRFGEQRLGDPDLANVVEQRAQLDRRDLLGPKAQLASDLHRVVHRRRGVP